MQNMLNIWLSVTIVMYIDIYFHNSLQENEDIILSAVQLAQ